MADIIVGRFALIDLIARGGSGAVWRAWDVKKERYCAAKVLLQRDSADLMRFVREKAVSFDHPHLLTPYGWGAEDAHVVIAMPLATGGTLHSLLKKQGPLGEEAVTVILQQLLRGLEHVHAQGWVHRDVKPANVMFTEPRFGIIHAVLSDFGIAMHRDDVRFTSHGHVNGTPGYMAPELFSLAEPTPSSDLYALGVLALVALNGKVKLHDGAFREDELDTHLAGVSPQLASVIRHLLLADPAKRYQHASAVLASLPYVPPSTQLTLRDGKPLHIGTSLPPLPPGAPGPAHTPGAHTSKHVSMERIRAGRGVQSVSSAPSAGTPTPRPMYAPQNASAQGGQPQSQTPRTPRTPQTRKLQNRPIPTRMHPVAGPGSAPAPTSAGSVPAPTSAAQQRPVGQQKKRIDRAGYVAIGIGTVLAIVAGGGASYALFTML